MIETNRLVLRRFCAEGAADVFECLKKPMGDNNELYFRDYLIEHPNAAEECKKRKLDLRKKQESSMESGTEEF